MVRIRSSNVYIDRCLRDAQTKELRLFHFAVAWLVVSGSFLGALETFGLFATLHGTAVEVPVWQQISYRVVHLTTRLLWLSRLLREYDVRIQ